jgi:HK97 family phage prohead protease
MDTKILYQQQTTDNLIVKSLPDNNIIISGYASVYNVADQHNDLIIKGAFTVANNSQIKFLWQHDQQKPIGIIKTLMEDDYGLKIEGVINHKVEAGKEAIELVRQGAVDGLSIGFNIKLANYNKLNQRVISKAELMEVSIVTFPANDYAKISHITKQAIPMESKMDSELITKHHNNEQHNEEFIVRINELQQKMYNLENYLTRPEIGGAQDIQYKAAFNNYIRQGNQEELIEKSLNSGDDAGGVLLVPALYDNILSEIKARSPMRQLASIETISTNAIDIVVEDGNFASGWVGDDEARNETTTSKLKYQRIFVHELYAQPKASQNLISDAAIKIENWLIERLRDSFVKVD